MSSDRERILRTLLESNAPYFGKTLTRAMLQRNERLGIPMWFLQAHGHRLHRVLSLTGPNGKSRPVTLSVRVSVTRFRIYLCQGWKAFVMENGFQMGDEVIFWLVARSSFRVLVCSLEKATMKGYDDTITSDLAPQHTNHEAIQVPPCCVNYNAAEEYANYAHESTCCVEVEPFQRPTSNVREEEYVNYPGLNSAVTANSRFPQFVKKLTPNNLRGKHSIPLELPFSFVKEHEDELQEHVALLGASGHLRVVNLRITTFFGQSRVHLGKGWKDFSLENGFSEGDVLLFSLVGLSTLLLRRSLEPANEFRLPAVFP